MSETSTESLKFKRILLKLSGEALMGETSFGIDPNVIKQIASEIQDLDKAGAEIAVVLGAGNFFRGSGLAAAGIDRVTADHMGMLGTVMNSLALQDALEQLGMYVRVMSAIVINEVCEDYIRRRAIRHLEKRRVVIFAGGTGNPYFTTDTAASLRAMEISAEVIFKATKVDGIYSADPMTDETATKYQELSYLDVLKKGLKVMDSTSVSLCMDNKLPMVIFNFRDKHSIKRVLLGEKLGTTVGA